MALSATLRRSGGSVILSIPKPVAEAMAVTEGSVVELTLEGRRLSVTPARRGLAERLAASPGSPADWVRDDDDLTDRPVGRELL